MPQFRLHVADRLHKHYHNDGALTTANTLGRFLARKEEIDRAIVGESARWGDAHSSRTNSPLTRDGHWVNAINNLVNYFNGRSTPAFNQLVADGLYPTVEVADFYIDGRRQHGGEVPLGAELSIALGQGGQNYNDTILMPANAAVRTLVPTAASSVDTTWFTEGFSVPAAWGTGTYGVGYDTAADYDSLINIDTQASMLNLRTGVYMRSTFTWSGSDDFDRLLLRMKYDDGFVVYLNGVKVLTVLAPGSVAWNSAATANHEANANQFEDFDISAHLGLLHAGTNVLAIHGMNVNTGSTDLVFAPELRGGVLIPGGTSKPVYLTTDGSDPRLVDGSISPSATLYTAPLALNESAIVKARTFDTLTHPGARSPKRPIRSPCRSA